MGTGSIIADDGAVLLSAGISLAVAAAMAILAALKGRTAWHWFVLTVIAYAAIVSLSVLSLFLANVRQFNVVASPKLAAFAGVVTCSTIAFILIMVPRRPRPHGGAAVARAQNSKP
jgi:hypothetical protein